jgi:hypothetical protein
MGSATLRPSPLSGFSPHSEQAHCRAFCRRQRHHENCFAHEHISIFPRPFSAAFIADDAYQESNERASAAPESVSR